MNEFISNYQVKLKRIRAYVQGKIFKDANEGYLRQDTFWIRSVSWSIIGTTILGISWLSFAKTEEIIVVPGKIVPIGDVKNIQMPMGGIAKNILVSEGDYVERGTVLLELDKESILERRKMLVRSINLKLSEQMMYIELNKEEQNMLNKIRSFDKKILNRLGLLQKEGAISDLEYLRQEQKLQESQSKFNQSKTQLERQNSIYEQELAELRGRLAETLITLNQMSIKSPVSGLVFDLQPTNIGYSAQMTDTILKLVPLGDLEARVEIPSNDIGFVSKGMEVDISIDSYPASDFGVIKGRISRIGSDALKPDQNQNRGYYTYPANIALVNQKLKLKDGSSLDLKVGMSLNANIKLRKVSYLQLLLTTFKDKTDSIREL